MADTKTYTTIERVVLDGEDYQTGLKKMAAAIRENNKVARDAALVQAELAKHLGETATKQIDLSKAGGELFRSYKDISQGARDFLQIAKKVNDWLSKSSPEWKAQADALNVSTDAMGKAVAESKLMQGVMGGVSRIVDLATVSIAGFTGSLEKVPYQKLADFLVMVRGSLGLKLSDKDLQAMLTPFVSKQNKVAAASWGAEGPGSDENAGKMRRFDRFGREITGKKGGARSPQTSWRTSDDNEGVGLTGFGGMGGGSLQESLFGGGERMAFGGKDGNVFGGMSEELNALASSLTPAYDGAKALGSALAEAQVKASEADLQLRDMAVGGLEQLAGGLWSAADAAIQSGQGFGTAILQMTKATLLGVASQATIKALFNFAEGLSMSAIPFGAGAASAALYFASAAKFGVVAAVAGGAGLALSAATAPSTSSGGASRGSGAAGQYRASSSSFGSKSRREDKPQPIIVEVYMGDRSNRAAAMQLEKQLTARIRNQT